MYFEMMVIVVKLVTIVFNVTVQGRALECQRQHIL